MSRFSLTNFLAESQALNNDTVIPSWVESSSVKAQLAYQEVLNEEQKILELIASGKTLSSKEKRIIPATIAKNIAVDRSYIVRRRLPELCSLIELKNEELESLYSAKHRNLKSLDSKSSLARELAKFKRLLKEERDKNLSQIITEILKSGQFEESSRVAERCADLEAENKELLKANASLRSRLRIYTMKRID